MKACLLIQMSLTRSTLFLTANITQVLAAEVKEMGQGLVEDVDSAPSCKRMGP